MNKLAWFFMGAAISFTIAVVVNISMGDTQISNGALMGSAMVFLVFSLIALLRPNANRGSGGE
jgi:hypothetical protein